MALANIPPRIRKEYLEALVTTHPSYVVRPLRYVVSPDEASEIVLEIINDDAYLKAYVGLSGSMKATTNEIETTPSGRRILARSPSGKALPSGYLDKAVFDMTPKDVVTAYILPDHPSYEKLIGLVAEAISGPKGPPLADAQHLATTSCGVWIWV
jgi:hypothetical protein